MKKNSTKPVRTKKLEIQRETLRKLHDDWLRQIRGGVEANDRTLSHSCEI